MAPYTVSLFLCVTREPVAVKDCVGVGGYGSRARSPGLIVAPRSHEPLRSIVHEFLNPTLVHLKVGKNLLHIIVILDDIHEL